MTINPNNQESSPLAISNNKENLIKEISSTKSSEVSPFSKALLSYELIKESLEKGEINPSTALDFGQSLVDYNLLPVVIGTEENKIFPITSIMDARHKIINNYVNTAQNMGIDLIDTCQMLKEKAKGVSDLLEIGSDWVAAKYGDFTLSPEDAQIEVMNKVKQNAAAQELLGQSNTSEQQEAATSFIKLNFANFIVGNMITDFVKANYQYKLSL